MLVKKKNEIISLGLPEIKPSELTGPYITPMEFKHLMDDGEDMLVLDTRNVYETRVGSFEGSLELGISTFREFPKAIESIPEEYKSKTVVMYCTG